MSKHRTLFLSILLLILAAVAVFGRVVTHDFVHYDDNLHIYNNPLLSPVSPTNLRLMWSKPYSNLYIPLSYMLFGVLSLISRTAVPVPRLTDTGVLLDPRVFHVASLFFHALNAILVLLLLRQWVKKPLPAFFGALLWAIHPFQVESVGWASELRGLFSALFALLSLLVISRSKADSDNVAAPRMAAAILLGVCAMLAKPSAIVLPFIMALVEGALLHRPWRAVVLRNLLFLAFLVPFAVITTSAQATQLPGPFHAPSLFLRPLIALDTIGFYLAKLVWPWPLITDYERTTQRVLSGHWYLATGCLTLAVAGFAVLLRKRAPWIGIGASIMVLSLLPVLGLTPFIYQYYSTVADRYMYFALLGPAYCVAMALSLRPKRWAYGIAGAAAILFGVVSFVQVAYWKNTTTLFEHEIAYNKNCISAWSALATDDVALHKYAEALALSAHEITANPGDYRSYNDLGADELDLKRYREALPLLEKADSLRPDGESVHSNLGAAYRGLGRDADAIREDHIALEVSPVGTRASIQLAEIYQDQKRNDLAEYWYRDAIRRDGQDPAAYSLLAGILAAEHRDAEALKLLQTALKLDPANGKVAYDIGLLLNQDGNESEALPYFAYAVKYAPELEEAHLALGVQLGRKGDLADAAAQFRKAVQLDPQDTEAQKNLQLATTLLSRKGP